MSIIDEALQKTQKSRNNATSFIASVEKRRIRLALPKIPIHDLPWRKISISAGACALLYFAFTHYTQIGTSITHFTQHQPKPAITTQVTNKIPENSKFDLSGTFLSDHDRIALINNRTLHVGDTVNGMLITAIDLNSVTLKNEDATLILHTDTHT